KKTLYAYSLRGMIEHVPTIFVDHVHLTASGIHATVFTPWGEGKLQTALIGQFNLSNMLAVLTTLCLLDISLKDTLIVLSQLTSVAGRMQRLGGGEKPLVVVDYAHTPDALEKVLVALRQHTDGKLYCIFGCGGDRDRGKRPMMAVIAERYADRVIVTDDNPRTEDPKQIVTDILKGFSKPNSIIVEHDRSKAIRDVIQCAKSGDCIIIAGKGAETYQIIGTEKIPFSDVEQVNDRLREKN
ncbi:MAG TPA: UDP-N-acetylmuramyl-tripeptide synthetase, partial [Gammaproteobacteria bacterium]|nr:UDP-N-acetylmuramyl-tripeptide synthetase [Gammaproteobacteria bacterium]